MPAVKHVFARALTELDPERPSSCIMPDLQLPCVLRIPVLSLDAPTNRLTYLMHAAYEQTSANDKISALKSAVIACLGEKAPLVLHGDYQINIWQVRRLAWHLPNDSHILSPA